jgi:cephalosporin hydroxylase
VYLQKEMTAYCPLVTLGSYCIVEDTKLSRWSSNSVLQTVKDWVQDGKKGGGRFAIDRDRELLYTHHAFG